MGNRPSSRRVTIRLTRLTPSAGPEPPPAGPLWAAGAAGIHRCGLPGRPVTSTGATGSSMTSRNGSGESSDRSPLGPIPRRPAPVGTGFQNPNPPLQIGNDCPLAGNYLQPRLRGVHLPQLPRPCQRFSNGFEPIHLFKSEQRSWPGLAPYLFFLYSGAC